MLLFIFLSDSKFLFLVLIFLPHSSKKHNKKATFNSQLVSGPSLPIDYLGYRYFAYINDMLWLSSVKDPFHGQKAFAKNLLDIIACIIL